MLYNTYIKY